MAEPNAERPWPTGHVAHAAQLSVASVVLVPALNVPDAHAAHCRSLLAVAATVVREPGPHGALTATHALPSLVVEYVEPATHAAHWRSAMAEPNAERPWPTGHVAHATHAWLPEVALKVPSGHGEHTRSLVVV